MSRAESRPGAATAEPEWATWPDERLLDVRLCDLGLVIREGELADRIDQLHGELETLGLRFLPHFWLSDEWYCPDGVPGVAIPFYLAHPRLARLELTHMLEVEGGRPSGACGSCSHETGHAIETRLPAAPPESLARDLRQLVGALSRATSRPGRTADLRRTFGQWYAQSHPDEDFAETFAVWVAPERTAGAVRGVAGAAKARVRRRADARIARPRPWSPSRARIDELSRSKDAARSTTGDAPPLRPGGRRPTTGPPALFVGRPASAASGPPAGFSSDPPGGARRWRRPASPLHDRPGARPLIGAAQLERGRGLRQRSSLHLARTVLTTPRLHSGATASADEAAAGPGACTRTSSRHRAVDGRTGARSPWKTEFDVVSTLRSSGTRCEPLGRARRSRVIRDGDRRVPAAHRVQPARGVRRRRRPTTRTSSSYLELLRVPYTGCNPRGLMLAATRRSRRRSSPITGSRARTSPSSRWAEPCGGRGACPSR